MGGHEVSSWKPTEFLYTGSKEPEVEQWQLPERQTVRDKSDRKREPPVPSISKGHHNKLSQTGGLTATETCSASPSSRGQKSEIKVSAGPRCFPRLQGKILPAFSSFCRPQASHGVSWLLAIFGPSLPPSSHCLLLSLSLSLCPLWNSHKDTCHWF